MVVVEGGILYIGAWLMSHVHLIFLLLLGAWTYWRQAPNKTIWKIQCVCYLN